MKTSITLAFLSLMLFAGPAIAQFGPSPWTVPSSGTYTIPAGVTSLTIECRGGGGGGGGARASGGESNYVSSGGGGGGAYSLTVVDVTPGQPIVVAVGNGGGAGSNSGGNGGNGGVSSVTYNSVVAAEAAGGAGGLGGGSTGNKPGGAGGSTGTGTVASGGNGGNGYTSGSFEFGGGGGGGAGTVSNGGNGTTSTGSPVVPPPGGTGGNAGGGNGGNGFQGLSGNGSAGSAPGGGGGGAGAWNGGGGSGGTGGAGRVVITYATCSPVDPGPISGNISVCEGSSNVYAVAPVSGAITYTWTLPSGWSGGSTAESIDATSGAAGGTISVTANNDCGPSTPQTLNVTVNALPQVDLSLPQTTICNDPGQTITLDLGTPPGGTYSGPGVTGNTFDASALSAGNHVITYSYTDGAGCTASDTASIEVLTCTSIADRQGPGAISVHPNPFSNTIHLDLDGYRGEGVATITNVQGKEVQRVVFDASGRNVRLTTDRFENGVYFIRIDIGGSPMTVVKVFRSNDP